MCFKRYASDVWHGLFPFTNFQSTRDLDKLFSTKVNQKQPEKMPANWFKVTSSFNSCRSPTTCEKVTWTHHSKKGRQQNYGVDMFEMILYYGAEIRLISWCVINSTSKPDLWTINLMMSSSCNGLRLQLVLLPLFFTPRNGAYKLFVSKNLTGSA